MFGLAILLMLHGSVFAGVDKDDGDITEDDWAGDESEEISECYVRSSNNKPAVWPNRHYSADAGLKAGHVELEDATRLNHWHIRWEWQEDVNCPKVAEANEYWDTRFGKGDKTDRGETEGAVMKHKGCHEWALTESGKTGEPGATGTYDYEIAVGTPYGADVTATTPASNVVAGDILFYESEPGKSDHASYVHAIRGNGAGGNEPATLKWKWKGGGIYTYSTPNDGTNEFHTPMCQTNFENDVSTTKTISQQGWTWTVNFKSNELVFH